jgi:hypothetical protein
MFTTSTSVEHTIYGVVPISIWWNEFNNDNDISNNDDIKILITHILNFISIPNRVETKKIMFPTNEIDMTCYETIN